MKYENAIGSTVISLVVLGVGIALYQQNERHFVESQVWLDICLAQFEERKEPMWKRMSNDDTLPEDVRDRARRGMDAYDQDYLYSQCYKEWHAGGS